MRVHDRRPSPLRWTLAHSVEVVFGLLAVGRLLHVLRISGDLSFWADDLLLLEQAGSLGGLFEPYNGHMSLVILSTYRVSAELAGLSYLPLVVAGALSLLAVPVGYFVTTRRQLGPPLAALLGVPLLWYEGMSLRPALLNHYGVLLGAIACAAALNRGRRADGVLAAGLAFALCSAAGGVAVAGACILHTVLVPPPLRRWLAVLVPSALWGVWWVLVADVTSPSVPFQLTAGQAARMVRDLCTSPFYAVALDNRFLAFALMAAFLLRGTLQLRQGLAAGANFLAWTAAMVIWAVALVETRGPFADPTTFRYAYLSLGFALLAVVPRQAIRWPAPIPVHDRRWLAAAACIVVVYGGASALAARGGLQDEAARGAALGREADGTLLVLGLGEDVIPGSTPIRFFDIFAPHGSAERTRALMDRYGSPFDATTATADHELVDLGVVRLLSAGGRAHPGCRALTDPVLQPGIVAPGLGERSADERVRGPASGPLQLWSSEAFTVEVRRFGDAWVHLADVPGGRNVVLTLLALSTERLWEVRADGACVVGDAAPSS